MINRLTIRNFKSIQSLEINFKQFNLFCGENASGKTSVIHSILALVQENQNKINFDGDVIKIGDLAELKNFDSGSEISLEIILNNIYRKVTLKRNEDLKQIHKDILVVEPKEDTQNIHFENELFYLSSNRMGVMDVYSKGDDLFGTEGESTVEFLSVHKEDLMPVSYMNKFKSTFSASDIKDNAKFYEHVRFWLETITKEIIKIEPIPYTNQYVLTFGRGNNIRPINTGSGFSYVLPIIIMCLGSILVKDQPTIIIENPEIYLHPDAQIRLTEFLLFFSQYAQLIVETHSENMLKKAMDQRDEQNQIFVFKIENKETKAFLLNNTSFKTNPILYPEVQYKAFGIVSIELHILLYSILQEKFNTISNVASSIIQFDNHLLINYPNIPQKLRTYRSNTYNTLPSYIRNCIDHPEQINETTGSKYSFSYDELKKSIDFMLDII